MAIPPTTGGFPDEYLPLVPSGSAYADGSFLTDRLTDPQAIVVYPLASLPVIHRLDS